MRLRRRAGAHARSGCPGGRGPPLVPSCSGACGPLLYCSEQVLSVQLLKGALGGPGGQPGRLTVPGPCDLRPVCPVTVPRAQQAAFLPRRSSHLALAHFFPVLPPTFFPTVIFLQKILKQKNNKKQKKKLSTFYPLQLVGRAPFQPFKDFF